MSISVYSLGSGSKGNCVIISNGNSSVMVDAGLGVRSTAKKIREAGFGLCDINGILITHEHNDHIKSISELSDYIPVYSHSDTLNAFMYSNSGANIKNLNAVEEKSFCLGDFEITPFSVSHDAAHPYGFTINNGKEKVGYVTDTGYISKGILKNIYGCDVIVLESNHDTELLMRGNYPDKLKKRIFSDKGHLCNNETALTVCDLVKGGAKKFMLAHVSENNNLTELAYWTTVKKLEMTYPGEDLRVKVALQRETVIL